MHTRYIFMSLHCIHYVQRMVFLNKQAFSSVFQMIGIFSLSEDATSNGYGFNETGLTFT